MTSARLGAFCGFIFVALTLVGGIAQGDVPVYTDGSSAIREWFANNNGRYLAGGGLMVLGVLFYLPFLATLIAFLIRVEGTARPWPWLALLGGVHLLVAV